MSRFDETDYELIENIWGSKLVIDLFEHVDLIIKSEGLPEELKYLMIGDFLFSLHNKDIIGGKTSVLNQERSVFLYYIKFRCNINEFFNYSGYTVKKYELAMKKLLISAEYCGNIKRSFIKVRTAEGFNTVVLLKVKAFEVYFKKDKISGVSKAPFYLKTISESEYSVSSFRNMYKTKRIKTEMDDVFITFEGVRSAQNMCFILNDRLFDINKRVLDKYEINLLDKLDCNDYEDYL